MGELWPKHRAKLVVAGAAILLLAAAAYLLGRINEIPPRIPLSSMHKRSNAPAQVVKYSADQYVENLLVPWDIVFTSADRWLISERRGTLRIVEHSQLKSQPLATFSEVSSTAEEGLMGLALDPQYSSNHMIYACYATFLSGTLVDKVVKFEDKKSTIGSQTTLISGIPAAQNHAGCRVAFGPDKKLYITTGDATTKTIAQDMSSLGGKILRINSDGSIPGDNPFKGSAIWSLGHRNPQGLAWQPTTGNLYATEHGPSDFDGPPGGDEINLIQKGGNYGWPTVSHLKTDPRFTSPVKVFTPALAPSGAVFYTGSIYPQLKGAFIFAALKGEGLYQARFVPKNPSTVLSVNKLPDITAGRIRTVAQAPDGRIVFLTSNRDGRGNPRAGDDALYMLVPTR